MKARAQENIQFVLAIEFVCSSCTESSLIKVENPEGRILCPRCEEYEIIVSELFDQLLGSMRHPTPNRKSSPRRKRASLGRPPFEGMRRQKTEITLHPDTIDALNDLDVSRGALFEWLLRLFPPYRRAIERLYL